MSGWLRIRSVALPFLVSLGSLGVGKLLQIGLLVLMARRMDVAAFGALGILINSSQIGAYAQAAGLSNGATRMVAAFEAQKNWGALSGFLIFSLKLLGVTAIATLIVGALVAALGWIDPPDAWYLVVLTVVSGVGIARAGLALGLRDVAGSLLPREVLAPLISISVLLVLLNLGSTEVALVYLAGFVVAEVAGAALLAKRLPAELSSARPQSTPRRWLATLLPMQAVALMTIALQRIDLVFVGLLFDLQTAAIYAAAQRVAQVLNVLGRVSAVAAAPQIARAYHVCDRAGVWRAVWSNVVLGAALGIPVCLVLIAASETLMGLFGEAYMVGAGLLVTLSIGQLISAVLGPMTQALTMTEFERLQTIILAVLCALSAPGFWVAATIFGVWGVAAFSVLLWTAYNAAALLVAVHKVGN